MNALVLPGKGCPCGLGASYAACCGRVHLDQAAAETPEQLMRSRFTAFARRDVGYLLRSWHPDTRPAPFELDESVRWERLEILDTVLGGPDDDEGFVEFRAHYLAGRSPGSQHERSRFRRHGGVWHYLDGAHP